MHSVAPLGPLPKDDPPPAQVPLLGMLLTESITHQARAASQSPTFKLCSSPPMRTLFGALSASEPQPQRAYSAKLALLLINANVESLSPQPSWKLLETFHLRIFSGKAVTFNLCLTFLVLVF